MRYGDYLKITPGWYALYEYAAVNWGHHVRRATISTSNVDQAALELLHSESKINAAMKIQAGTRGPCTFPPLQSVSDSKINGLHLAAFCGLDRVIPSLMATFEVNSKDSNGRTALSWASEAGWHAVVKCLLLADADFEVVEDRGRTPLHFAARSNRVEVVQLLIDAGISVDAVNADGDTALHYAARPGHVEVMQLLIDASISVDAVNADGDTALHLAVWFNHVVVVQLLIDAGISVDVANACGDTALHYTAQKDLNTIAHLLLTHGARFDISNRNGQVPLNVAVRSRARQVYATLCKMGANPKSCGDDSRTILMEAVCFDDEALVTALLEEKCDLEAQDNFGRTALMKSCGKGQQTIVEALLQHNPRLDIQDHSGETALIKAIKNQHWHVASQLLLSNLLQKYPYLKPIYYGATILVSGENQQVFVKVLLEKGVLVSAETHNDLPLLAALTGEHGTSEGYESIIELLLYGGIDLTECKEKTSRKLIVEASKRGNEEFVRWLIAQGISVHGADETHDTPLVAASRGRHKSIVKLLRAEGARFTRNSST
jgi:ankyrin repeat protein